MLFQRVIPVLLLKRRSLVKSVQFRNPTYIGDPINTVRIFNEREVDELLILDIAASPSGTGPQYDLLEEIAAEAFMPFGYGGGVTNVDHARDVFRRGAEKVIVNQAALQRPGLITELADTFGSQSIVVSIDCRRRRWRDGWNIVTSNARKKWKQSPCDWAREASRRGAGELLLTSVDQDGTFGGYDCELMQIVADEVDIPVVGCGGAGQLSHIEQLFETTTVSAAAAGSLFIYQGSQRAVLVNYPTRDRLDLLLDTVASKSAQGSGEFV